MSSYERLCRAVDEHAWNVTTEILKPKNFRRDEKGRLKDKKILYKVAEILTDPMAETPDDVKIILLKCLLNSCIDGCTDAEISQDELESATNDYCHEFYKTSGGTEFLRDDPVYFPYHGIVEWSVGYVSRDIVECENPKNHSDILRLCIQFLCNYLAFFCRRNRLPGSLSNANFKSAVIGLIGSENVAVAKVAHAFVCNMLKFHPENYFDEVQTSLIAENSISANKLGLHNVEALVLLMKRPGWLQEVYENFSAESKLYLLETIYQELRDSETDTNLGDDITRNFPIEVIRFLSLRFKKRSDLILKTAESYLDGIEPTEIMILLDIIGVISSTSSVDCRILQDDKSLMINCIFLLKSVHMTGREGQNYFTPVQKLSELAPGSLQSLNSSGALSIQDHPAFGFKAALIRAIGNLAHEHKINQQLLRETDAIPLLLDCCNVDARNPLIMQWTILALRNVSQNSPENQEIIANCTKIGVVNNDLLREMGLKLHEDEDGKSIGIVPLPSK